MLLGRYIRPTREGVYYLLVLGFIIGGAILREVNLLVLLAGMMIGPLLFSWRWAGLSLAGLTLRRRMPLALSAGEALVVEFEVENQRRRLTSWAVLASDSIRRTAPESEPEPTLAEAIIPAVAPGASSHGSYRCLITRRGRYEFGPVWLSTSFPLGLVRAGVKMASSASLIVCPRQGRLTRQWDNWLDAQRAGQQRNSPRRGVAEGDYYAMRQWRSGDSQRWIHWRTSARLNELAVRQFEDQRSTDVMLLLDLWSPPELGDALPGHLEVAVSLAATAVVDLSRRGVTNLGIAIHGRECKSFLGPGSTNFAREVLEYLATVQGAVEDRLEQAVAPLEADARPETRLIVFSTRTVDIEALAPRRAASSDRPERLLAAPQWVNVATDDLSDLFVLETPDAPLAAQTAVTT